MKANEISQATNKPIFAFFTGSDWCGWCKKLERDVFSKAEFVKWAKENVILLELDFPRTKTLSPELMQQNQSLQQAFQVRGYPTIWLFFLTKSKDGTMRDINPLGSLGYPQGAEPGKEQVKFLQDGDSLLLKKQNLGK
jgi:thioredoxin-related protein